MVFDHALLDFKQHIFFDPQTNCLPHQHGPTTWISLAHLTPIVHWLLKGGNTTINYPNIQFLRK